MVSQWLWLLLVPGGFVSASFCVAASTEDGRARVRRMPGLAMVSWPRLCLLFALMPVLAPIVATKRLCGVVVDFFFEQLAEAILGRREPNMLAAQAHRASWELGAVREVEWKILSLSSAAKELLAARIERSGRIDSQVIAAVSREVCRAAGTVPIPALPPPARDRAEAERVVAFYEIARTDVMAAAMAQLDPDERRRVLTQVSAREDQS